MDVLHCSFECYPAAKVGGLADVAGALPKYLNQAGVRAALIMPKFNTPWLNEADYAEDFNGSFRWFAGEVSFRVLRETKQTLGFTLYVVELSDLFYRRGIYVGENGYPYFDEVERYIAFQLAVLTWLRQFETKPDVLHAHDHHCGLIPLMMRFSPEFESLKAVKTIFTIHNGLYQGAFGWEKKYLLPYLPVECFGLLDWNYHINPMAAAVKCADAVTTVSNGYLQELMQSANSLEHLFRQEHKKCYGFINGIDDEVWNPANDKYIACHLTDDVANFKMQNKLSLCKEYGFDSSKPLFVFIGRLVQEKGADLIPDAVNKFLQHKDAHVLLLGSGAGDIEYALRMLSTIHASRVRFAQGYNEPLAHRMYASADFLLMPSRIEPCGLNQMYAMHYGTLPIVNNTGGLHDTVFDLTESTPRGIKLNKASINELYGAMLRAHDLFDQQVMFQEIRKEIIKIDFSWTKAVQSYVQLYQSITKHQLAL
jgi:starch synthase